MTASVLLEYSEIPKTYTDNFHRWEALSTRYTQVQEAAAPLDKAQFMRQWCFEGPMKSPPRSGEALSAILPAFQLKANMNMAPASQSTPWRPAGAKQHEAKEHDRWQAARGRYRSHSRGNT